MLQRSRIAAVATALGVVASLMAALGVAQADESVEFTTGVSEQVLHGNVTASMTGSVTFTGKTGDYTIKGSVSSERCPAGTSIGINRKVVGTTGWRRIFNVSCEKAKGDAQSFEYGGNWDTEDEKLLLDVCGYHFQGIAKSCSDDAVIHNPYFGD